jgi:septal ring factor EnvC (AmiA/AmiB activator)
MNKQSITEEIKDIIDGMARSGALTPDAIRQFDEMRQQAALLEAELTEVKKQHASTKDQLSETQRQLNSKTVECYDLKTRAETAEKKNREADKALWVAEFEKERRVEMRSILSDVFRNAELNRTLMKSVPVAGGPSYPGGPPMVTYHGESGTETHVTK